MSKHVKCVHVLRHGALFPPQDAPRAQTLEQMHQSPRLWGVAQNRWSLAQWSRHCPPLQDLSQSGVWRRLRKWKLSLRRTRNHITSPDAAYRPKLALLVRAQEAARRGELVLLYGDEHTFYRQPLAAPVWHAQGGAGKAQPRCVRHTGTDTKRRTVGALNAHSGQVHWHGCSRSRVKELCRFLQQLRQAYGEQRVVLVWDNWPVHLHHKVLECASQHSIELLWLPTYAPWLNPIEKLWKWLKADVLTAHRHSAAWQQLRQEVEEFLNRFKQPAPDLLRYCGLLTD
jgi:transposase